MNPKILKTIKIILPILLGVFLIWYSLSKVPLTKIIEYWVACDKKWVLLGVILGVLSHLSRGYRWLYMFQPMGYKVRLPNSIMSVFATYLINYTIPRSGEIARATIIANYDKVPFEKSFGTIVAERIADMIVMLIIIGITLVLQFDNIYDFLAERFQPSKIITGIVGLGVIIGILYMYIRKSKSNFALKVKKFFNGLIEGLLSIINMKHKWAYILHTLFIWGMYVLMFYVTSFCMPELDALPFGAIMIAFIFASFTVAATNGGIGAYPLAVAAAFGIFGIQEEPAIAFGYIMWASQTFMIIILGGLSLLLLPIYNKVANRTK